MPRGETVLAPDFNPVNCGGRIQENARTSWPRRECPSGGAGAVASRTRPSYERRQASAQRSYGDFLALWKDADPDTPIYKQAKAEYAKLQEDWSLPQCRPPGTQCGLPTTPCLGT